MMVHSLLLLSFEVAAIGDDIDGLDVKDGAGRLGGLGQKSHVDDLVGHGKPRSGISSSLPAIPHD